MVKVSIIVPVYNVERYLRECLDSCLSQTLKDIEIIAVNDGSPDNSIDILREYEKKDSRVIVIDKKNEGVGKARNDGIKKASGEFIAFMDSDDYYPSGDVLENLYNSAKNNCVKIAGGKKIRLNSDGSEDKQQVAFTDKNMTFGKEGKCKYSEFQYDYGYTLYIYDRKMLIENDIYFPPYKRFQDPPFFVKAMITAGEYYMNDIYSYCYRAAETTPKWTLEKTVDFIHGLRDNLNMAKNNNFVKLYYLSALRLFEDGSFMSIQNVDNEKFPLLFNEYINLFASIDKQWLRDNGYDIADDYLPELFVYLITSSLKYENIRNNSVVKKVSKLLKR